MSRPSEEEMREERENDRHNEIAELLRAMLRLQLAIARADRAELQDAFKSARDVLEGR